MNLKDDWLQILRKAWSIRLALLAAVLSALEVIAPLFVDTMPRGYFALGSFALTLAAMLARLVAQPKSGL